jgi:hypothetical protein
MGRKKKGEEGRNDKQKKTRTSRLTCVELNI